MTPGESYAEYMRRVEAALRERVAEANTFPSGSKERHARLGTARTVLVGVRRMAVTSTRTTKPACGPFSTTSRIVKVTH